MTFIKREEVYPVVECQESALSRLAARSGMSLIELVVSMGLLTIVGGLSSYILLKTQEQVIVVIKKSEAATDASVAMRGMWVRMSKSGPSLNSLNLPDDNEKNFFDYFRDVPERLLDEDNRTRTFTVTPNNTKIFYCFFDASRKYTYEPADAYSVDYSGGINQNAPLGSAQVNLSSVLADTAYQGQIWQAGQILRFESPIEERPINDNYTLNYGVPARPMLWYGLVRTSSDTDIVALPKALQDLIQKELPRDGITNITSVDQFFKALPAAGGAQPVVYVSVVGAMKIFMRSSPQGGQVIAQVWDSNANDFGSELIMAQKISKIEFLRESVANPALSVKMYPETSTAVPPDEPPASDDDSGASGG